MQPPLAARIAILSFGLLSLTGMWIIVRGGGFYHAPGKFSADAEFYAGPPALLMATLQGAAAALAFTWLLRLRFSAFASALTAVGIVAVPPALYLSLAL